MSELHTIDFARLRDGIGCLAVDHCQFAHRAAGVALSRAGHNHEVMCQVVDRDSLQFTVILRWVESEPSVQSRSFRSPQRLGEFAAEALAFLLIEDFTPYTVVGQALESSGVDYHLEFKDTVDCASEAEYPPYSARLEVSGILQPSRGNTFGARVRQKLRQTEKSDSTGTPAYVIVVDFSTPSANITKRQP